MSGAPEKIRTSDLNVRNVVLYPAKLRVHIVGVILAHLRHPKQIRGIMSGRL